MGLGTVIKYYFQLATDRNTFRRAVKVAIFVGIILNLINNPGLFYSLSLQDLKIGRVILTFLVPYFVSTYSSVLSNSNLKPGSISHLDAILKCKSCRKTNFHIHIGQPIEECPKCKKKTRWKPLQIFSSAGSNSEMLKNLALFARHNPQPLLRIDSSGIILGANPASEILFEKETMVGERLNNLLPEINTFDLESIVAREEIKETVIAHSGKFYNLVLKGVPALNTVHVYGNDITQIVLAEQKIKSQSRDIQESIQYAWLIQKAMLPHSEIINKIFPSHFIFYRPRNTVSGDFYWINKVGNFKIAVVADCTGHGVPGAFMSMLGISLLNEIVLREKCTKPGAILNTLRERLTASLASSSGQAGMDDGMDITLVVIDCDNNILSYAGAF
ncbi:MAG: SpoIIE family protein phosphatase [Chloroflexia bacterium]|nr:SpoIIE family protein phosphatase [Chloroflexia bacterium]